MICLRRPANKRFLKGWLNRLNDFKWLPLIIGFLFLFSCKPAQKTTISKRVNLETIDSLVINTEQQVKETESREQWQWNTDERWQMERLRILFDTVGAYPNIKQLDIVKWTKEQNTQGEKQEKSIRTESGTKEIREKVKIDRREENQSTEKRSQSLWWMGITGLIIALIVFLRYLMRSCS
jgi:hypothetical protein